ncbi:MAG: hypothetical protein ABL888_18215 [Pirellulaceae bacterium]
MKLEKLRVLLALVSCFFCYQSAFSQSDRPAFDHFENLLMDDDFLEHLDLLENQKEKIKNELADVHNRRLERSKRIMQEFPMPPSGDPGVANWHKDIERELLNAKKVSCDERRSVVMSNFPPSQFRRFENVAAWYLLNSKGIVTYLESESVSKHLDVQKPEMVALKRLAADEQEAFEREFFELRQKYRQKLYEKLSPKAKDELNELLGEPSRISTPNLKF